MSTPCLENAGFCNICMSPTRFVAHTYWLRESYVCERCRTIPRHRAIVEVLNLVKPGWRDLKMHESSPSPRFLAKFSRDYSASFFREDLPLGADVDGDRNEDIENLTFADESFDIFITQDVLEHVFHPDKAVREIVRVLRPEGIHVFTTPKHKYLLKSFPRASLIDGRIQHLHEPNYHGNPIGDGRSLVTWDYGADFDDLAQRWSGYNTSNFVIRDRSRGIDGEYLDVFVTKKAEANKTGS
ncbi:MAG TPA: class I SAM-dependent methyltransferase [Bryobacteraceae bacterium]|nr:class I SAM-dependent methyltransferase [Bryobacteraceae bacterium]